MTVWKSLDPVSQFPSSNSLQVINERDILGTQLVRRNDELALLYEKIKIQQSTLSKGELQYRQRLEDIRLLKLEIKKLRREKNILNKNVANVDDLKWVNSWIGLILFMRSLMFRLHPFKFWQTSYEDVGNNRKKERKNYIARKHS